MWFGARSVEVGEEPSGDRRVRFTPQAGKRLAENIKSLMEQSARHAAKRARHAETAAGAPRVEPPTLVETERRKTFRVA